MWDGLAGSDDARSQAIDQWFSGFQALPRVEDNRREAIS
jgi:hypothetical protein